MTLSQSDDVLDQSDFVVVKVIFPLFMLFFSRLSMSTFMYLVFSACPLSTSNLLKPGVFAEGSVLWNVNMRLCVMPEEPIFAGDKTPSY